MNEILNFVKEIFMLESSEKCPVGLCSFEHSNEKHKKTSVKKTRKKEMRLSELME
ncbi:MAG: hypothetical protein LUH11_00895 [Candidatus Gastranaerophilales bacterium]|nr:hypothetical protein [Candidatus Gastranaerophilales bacterium]